MEWVLMLMTFFVVAIVSINNLPQTIIPLIRAEMIRKKAALIIIFLAASTGYLFQGELVSYTVAYKLFHYQDTKFLIGVLISSLFLTFSTVYNVSTSIQQLIILSLFGVYISSGEWVNMKMMGLIFLSWFGNMLLTMFFVIVLSAWLKRLLNSISMYNRAMAMEVVALFSSILLAYAMGANTFGTISSILGANISTFHSKLAILVSMSYGIIMFNIFGELRRSKLMESFDVYQITCVQIACGASVIIFSTAGIPVSIIHALLAGLATTAFLKGMNVVKIKMEYTLIRNLLLVPLLSLLTGIFAGFLFF